MSFFGENKRASTELLLFSHELINSLLKYLFSTYSRISFSRKLAFSWLYVEICGLLHAPTRFFPPIIYNEDEH